MWDRLVAKLREYYAQARSVATSQRLNMDDFVEEAATVRFSGGMVFQLPDDRDDFVKHLESR